MALRKLLTEHFYPRPPRGGRRLFSSFSISSWIFLSTPSARRATFSRLTGFYGKIDFYPRPPRGGRPAVPSLIGAAANISIHALREEGDLRQAFQVQKYYISIHALREEGDEQANLAKVIAGTFLSTPSARRATGGSGTGHSQGDDFYPRPPRGGRLRSTWAILCSRPISIHALREEGDQAWCAARPH